VATSFGPELGPSSGRDNNMNVWKK